MGKEAETYVLQPCRTAHAKSVTLIAKGRFTVILNRSFYIMLENLSKSTIDVPKHAKVARLTKYPALAVALIDDVDSYDEPLIAFHIYEENFGKKTIVRKHQAVATTNPKRLKKTGRKNQLWQLTR